jgi:hypothetical protein
MKRAVILFSLILFSFIIFSPDAKSQDEVIKRDRIRFIVDSLARKGMITDVSGLAPEIRFNRTDALIYLGEKLNAYNWKNLSDPLRMALGQLVYLASGEPFDSTKQFLLAYPYDSINLPWEKYYVTDSLMMKIPVILPARFFQPPDSVMRADTFRIKYRNDSLRIDYVNLPGDSVIAYRPVIKESTVILKDTVLVVVTDTLRNLLPMWEKQPFRFYRYPYQGDSLAAAVKYLVNFIEERDSSIVNFEGISGSTVPVWLNSRSNRMVRYWLKNGQNDSVTVWIGGVGRDSIGLFLEEGILFKRPVKQTNISDAQLTIRQVNSAKLQDVNKMYIKPHYWKLSTEANVVLNQSILTNWVKGGESSISTLMDITGFANYNNKEAKLNSANFIRLKYGLIKSGNEKVRKNFDLLESSSKFNHKAFGKFDFSATVLFKTQIYKGYNYPNDSMVVSKFLNPATMTLGFGLDYKPEKNTSINFAPLSYKLTFVTDTVNIDQTKYGIARNRRSLHEPGVSLMITNEFKPIKTVIITNRLQLFTNYINNPQNIDVDWEMIATLKINWFTDVRFNTHIIFDDDTKTPLYQKDGQPVTLPDGTQKKTARVQFRELLGFSFVFRF